MGKQKASQRKKEHSGPLGSFQKLALGVGQLMSVTYP